MLPNIWIMDIDGSNKIQITENLSDIQYFDFSPDGLKIVYSASVNHIWDIFMIDLDGKNLINLTKDSGFNKYPRFSSDGSLIAYICESLSDTIFSQIYMTDINGSNKYKLYEDWIFCDLVFSPDGTKLAFNSSDLYIINVDGTNLKYLTDLGHADWRAINFSPDGSKIVYIQERS